MPCSEHHLQWDDLVIDFDGSVTNITAKEDEELALLSQTLAVQAANNLLAQSIQQLQVRKMAWSWTGVDNSSLSSGDAVTGTSRVLTCCAMDA
jgi:hypothetical protein